MVCKICGGACENTVYLLKNVRKDLQETFEYVKCSECGCLQIQEIPENLGDYYDNAIYYSFQSINMGGGGIHKDLYHRIRACIKNVVVGTPLFQIYHWKWLKETKHRFRKIGAPQKEMKIVDIGCGNGDFVNQLCAMQYKNVLGIDPYLEKDCKTSLGGALRKTDIEHLEGEWDQMWMIHSLEHVPDPQKDLTAMARKLKETGKGIIILPVCDSYDWEKYGSDWAGSDAPVHLFLHTKKSLKLLFERAGLELVQLYNIESEWPLLLSEKIRCGYAIDDHSKSLKQILGTKKIRLLKKKMKQINAEKRAGMATFIVAPKQKR